MEVFISLVLKEDNVYVSSWLWNLYMRHTKNLFSKESRIDAIFSVSVTILPNKLKNGVKPGLLNIR